MLPGMLKQLISTLINIYQRLLLQGYIARILKHDRSPLLKTPSPWSYVFDYVSSHDPHSVMNGA